MNLIACVDKNWAIGNKGELLVSIPSDKKLFKELTDGKVVIGGRKTMEAIPGGTTLGGRTNIILTSDKKYTYGNAVIVHSIDEALEELKKYDDEDIFVIGGEKVYKEFYKRHEEADLEWRSNGDCIYTPDVIVFKREDDADYLPPEDTRSPLPGSYQ